MNSSLVFAAGMNTPLAIVVGMFLGGGLLLVLLGGAIWLGGQQEARDQEDARLRELWP